MEHPFFKPGEPITYSFSKLGSYGACPAKIYFRKLNLPTEPGISAEFGSAAHEHFEARLKEQENAFDAAETYLQENLYDKYDGKTLDKYKDKIEDAKRDMNYSIKSWEKACYPKIAGQMENPEEQVERKVEMPYRMGKFVGKIDLLFKQKIYDWKTGKVATEYDAKKNPQGGIYTKMCRFLKVAADQVIFVYTRGTNVATRIAKSGPNKGSAIIDKDNPVYVPVYRYADWSDEKVQAMMTETIDPLAEQYENGVLDKRGKLGFGTCGMCEYRAVCDDYSLPTIIED